MEPRHLHSQLDASQDARPKNQFSPQAQHTSIKARQKPHLKKERDRECRYHFSSTFRQSLYKFSFLHFSMDPRLHRNLGHISACATHTLHHHHTLAHCTCLGALGFWASEAHSMTIPIRSGHKPANRWFVLLRTSSKEVLDSSQHEIWEKPQNLSLSVCIHNFPWFRNEVPRGPPPSCQ